jgi:hypothetical protein
MNQAYFEQAEWASGVQLLCKLSPHRSFRSLLNGPGARLPGGCASTQTIDRLNRLFLENSARERNSYQRCRLVFTADNPSVSDVAPTSYAERAQQAVEKSSGPRPMSFPG